MSKKIPKKLQKALEHTNSLPDSHFGEESAKAEDLPVVDDWRLRHQEALKNSKEGDHAWFKFKDDPFDSCAKCGVVRRKDDKNVACRGKVKITLR